MPRAFPTASNIAHDRWVFACALCALLLVSSSAAAKRSTLGQLQRVLPASTGALVVVPVADVLTEALEGALHPGQDAAPLRERVSNLSSQRTGVDLLATETAALFLTEDGTTGVALLGELGSRALKRPYLRIEGVPAIELAEGVLLARVDGVVFLAPRDGVALLGKVARGERHRLLGTKRLQAFRSAQAGLTDEKVALYAYGPWLLRALFPRVETPVAEGLKIVSGTYEASRGELKAVGTDDALARLDEGVTEAKRILELQREFLQETADQRRDLISRIGQAILMEALQGLALSLQAERKGGQLSIRFSLPRLLTARSIPLFAALSSVLEVRLREP